MLTFRASDHTYHVDGRQVVNVTRVLEPFYDLSMVPADTLERARQEGVDIHRMAELHVKDDLDESTLPEWLLPRLAALKKFIAETGFEVLGSEQAMYHPTYRFAGTADLFGTMRVPAGRAERRVVACVDLKRSFLAGKVIGLQLAGYQLLWEYASTAKVERRIALRLDANGEYRCEVFSSPDDRTVFLAALTVHRWKAAL